MVAGAAAAAGLAAASAGALVKVVVGTYFGSSTVVVAVEFVAMNTTMNWAMRLFAAVAMKASERIDRSQNRDLCYDSISVEPISRRALSLSGPLFLGLYTRSLTRSFTDPSDSYLVTSLTTLLHVSHSHPDSHSRSLLRHRSIDGVCPGSRVGSVVPTSSLLLLIIVPTEPAIVRSIRHSQSYPNPTSVIRR